MLRIQRSVRGENPVEGKGEGPEGKVSREGVLCSFNEWLRGWEMEGGAEGAVGTGFLDPRAGPYCF